MCTSCWHDIEDGRREISPELRALMNESARKLQEAFGKAGNLVASWVRDGMSQDEALARFWGKLKHNKENEQKYECI